MRRIGSQAELGPRQRRYYLWSIGCQMNQADAGRIEEALHQRGYTPTREPKHADLILLNTCVVRQSAEDKVTGRLNSLRPLVAADRAPALLVMGCFVGDADVLLRTYPFVDRFFRPSDIAGVMEFVDRRLVTAGEPSNAGCTSPRATPVSQMVPISYGCDHHCTYCIVTLRRGPQRSRPMAEIRAEVECAVEHGAREIVLLGQNVDAYGTDLPDRPDLADLIEGIHGLEDLWRIRFLTSHPRDMTPRIVDTVARLPKACPCWELPIQSGDDQILRRMARGYTVAQYRDLVGQIRQSTPTGAINTDIIVGFPGETREQLERTLNLVEEIRFDVVHVAAYSVRPGTAAAAWADDVPAAEKLRRRKAVEDAQTLIATEINAVHLGGIVDILVDGEQKGRWRGRTRNNKLVFFESGDDWRGQMAKVRVIWTGPWSMLGDLVI